MKKISQTFSLVLVRAALLLLTSLCAAAVLAQSETNRPPLPPSGRLVDLGGWLVHINCMGEAHASQPTVVLEAGLGDFSVEWSLVQPGVAKFARVCSYDRAGDGWSELGPHPRTMRQIVYELHTLLANAGIKPPLVLVGHSYGGWLVRLYAATYPAEVVGMVLVEAGADNPRRFLPDGKLGYSSDLVKNQEIPAVKTSGPLRISDIPPAALKQMMSGAQSLAKNPNPPPRDKLPSDAQRMRAWALGQLGHVAAGVNPFEHEELALLRAERMKTAYPLGDMPLIVLTRGIPDEHGPEAKALEEEHRQAHKAIGGMSRKGKLIVATRSGHHVQLDEPELVIKSIREVVTAAQAGRPEQGDRPEPRKRFSYVSFSITCAARSSQPFGGRTQRGECGQESAYWSGDSLAEQRCWTCTTWRFRNQKL
jgi:pimeloyl-ACP methyl ester carboxylesterase